MRYLFFIGLFFFFVACSENVSKSERLSQNGTNKFYELKTPDLSIIDENDYWRNIYGLNFEPTDTVDAINPSKEFDPSVSIWIPSLPGS